MALAMALVMESGRNVYVAVLQVAVAFFLLGPLMGCGYMFQNSRNSVLEEQGIHSIYISPLINNTYKPGVENLVYNQVVKRIATHRRVGMTGKPENADVVLRGSVDYAEYVVASSSTADTIFPSGVIPSLTGPSDLVVATSYSAILRCTFSLVRSHPTRDKKTGLLWASGFSKSKNFPGNNQLDIFGTTSPLINDSEFNRALRDIAEGIASDLHESMLSMF